MYIWCMYGVFGRGITNYMVIYGVCAPAMLYICRDQGVGCVECMQRSGRGVRGMYAEIRVWVRGMHHILHMLRNHMWMLGKYAEIRAWVRGMYAEVRMWMRGIFVKRSYVDAWKICRDQGVGAWNVCRGQDVDAWNIC